MANDTFILRFSDPDDTDTISLHKEIIEKRGHVWWGWWKPDYEDFHQAEFKESRANLPYDGMWIGIFDRKSDSFYKARLKHIECDVNNFQEIDCPEKKNTPSYYSDKKLYCWFKLESIEKIKESEFNVTLFKAPGGVENTCIFESESKALEKRKESQQLEHPTLLHISDLHLGADFGFPLTPGTIGQSTLHEVLERDLKRTLKVKVGLLIISGDFTTQADSTTFFTEALDFIKDLLELLELSTDQLVVIPGNHDIPLDKYDKHNYKHERPFRLFLEKLYGEEQSLQGLDTFTLPDNRTLKLLRINSVRLRSQDLRSYGYTEWKNYESILSKDQETDDNYDSALKMAIMHHHLLSVPPVEHPVEASKPSAMSVTIDSGEIIDGLLRYGYQFVMHGHQHLPGLSKVSRGRINGDQELEGLDQDLYIISGGSIGVKPDRYANELNANSYNLITINDDHVAVRTREFNPSSQPRDYFKAKIPIG